jgi:hypothetical protein
MKKSLFILLVMVPLAVVAAQAYGHLLQSNSQIGQSITPANVSQRYSDGSQSLSGNNVIPSGRLAHNAPGRPFPDVKGDDKSEEDLDLRIVDWDKAKTDKKPKVAPSGKDKNGDNGEENGNGEEKEDEEEENGEDEKDEGNGGWDRQWDAPKLG